MRPAHVQLAVLPWRLLRFVCATHTPMTTLLGSSQQLDTVVAERKQDGVWPVEIIANRSVEIQVSFADTLW